MSLPVMPVADLPRQAYSHRPGHDPALTEPEKFRPVVNDKFMPKPEAGGVLWTATVTQLTVHGKIFYTTWTEYCRSENFGFDMWTSFLEIAPLPHAQIVRIDSLADLRAVHGEYGYIPDPRFPKFAAVVDWERMALDGVDAVFLTDRGQAETRFPDDGGPSFYGWDCESMLWLYPSYRVVS